MKQLNLLPWRTYYETHIASEKMNIDNILLGEYQINITYGIFPHGPKYHCEINIHIHNKTKQIKHETSSLEEAKQFCENTRHDFWQDFYQAIEKLIS